jgi:hypothetical protein
MNLSAKTSANSAKRNNLSEAAGLGRSRLSLKLKEATRLADVSYATVASTDLHAGGIFQRVSVSTADCLRSENELPVPARLLCVWQVPDPIPKWARAGYPVVNFDNSCNSPRCHAGVHTIVVLDAVSPINGVR